MGRVQLKSFKNCHLHVLRQKKAFLQGPGRVKCLQSTKILHANQKFQMQVHNRAKKQVQRTLNHPGGMQVMRGKGRGGDGAGTGKARSSGHWQGKEGLHCGCLPAFHCSHHLPTISGGAGGGPPIKSTLPTRPSPAPGANQISGIETHPTKLEQF